MDGAGLPRRAFDEAPSFERQDHLVHGRRRDSEVLLHFGLRWRVAVNFAVVIDERQVLPLFFCIVFFHCVAEKLYAETGRGPHVKSNRAASCHATSCRYLLEKRLAAASRLACTSPPG